VPDALEKGHQCQIGRKAQHEEFVLPAAQLGGDGCGAVVEQ
jgi:hypothetical protein